MEIFSSAEREGKVFLLLFFSCVPFTWLLFHFEGLRWVAAMQLKFGQMNMRREATRTDALNDVSMFHSMFYNKRREKKARVTT